MTRYNEWMSELEISVAELQKKKKAGEDFLLIDVREPWEYETCRIDGAKLIPMRTIPANLQQLDVDQDVICYCHHGQRSLDVAACCARREWSRRNRWRAALTAGRSKSTPRFPAIEDDGCAATNFRRADMPKVKVKFYQKPT